MRNYSKLCNKCGKRIFEGEVYCENCGNKLDSINAGEISEGMQINETAPKRKSGGKFISIVLSVIFFIICSLLGRFVGNCVSGEISENNAISEIDEYIEEWTYEPGKVLADVYVSEHFGFVFSLDENWEMYTGEELAEASENFRKSTYDGAYDTMKNQDLDQDVFDKWTESFYAATEMAARYVMDDMYVGELIVNVIGGYGLESSSPEEFVESIKAELMNIGHGVTSGKKTVNGVEYDVIECLMEAESEEELQFTSRMLIGLKDGICCMIVVRVVDGYEEQVFESFDRCFAEHHK